MTSTPERILQIGAARLGVPVEQLAAQLATKIERAPAPASRAVERAHARRVEAHAEPGEGPRPRRRARAPENHEARPSRSRMRTRSAVRGLPDFAPEDFSDGAIARAREAFRGPGSAANVLARMPRCYAQRVERAALAMRPTRDGRRVPTRDMGHVQARRIVGVAAAMLFDSGATRRHGMARILSGRCRGSFGALVRNPQTGAAYSRSTFFNSTHHRREGDPWDCGDVVALHRAGALFAVQPPAETQPARFVGRDRHGNRRALNQYWISSRACSQLDEHAPRELDRFEGDELHVDDAPSEPRGPP